MNIIQRKQVDRHERRRNRNETLQQRFRHGRACIIPLRESVIVRVVLVAAHVVMMNVPMMILIMKMLILVNAVILVIVMRDVDQARGLKKRMRRYCWPQSHQHNGKNLAHQPHSLSL